MVEVVAQVRVKEQRVVFQADQLPVQLHAFAGELPQVDVAPTITAGDEVVGVVAHAFAQRVLVHAHVVVAHVGQPVDHVLAAVEAGAAWRVAGGQHHLAAGQMQVFGQL